MTDSFNLWKQSILGGIAISLGCMAFLSVDNKYLGAFLFSIGLITICARGWALFTGKLCFTNFADANALIDLSIVWIGNFIGCWIMSMLYCLVTPDRKALLTLASGKIAKPSATVYFAGMFCELCIYIAVVGYKKIEADVGKYLSIILGVMIFILCGFEHCVADMFYLLTNGFNNSEALITGIFIILVATIGNAVGAILLKMLLDNE